MIYISSKTLNAAIQPCTKRVLSNPQFDVGKNLYFGTKGNFHSLFDNPLIILLTIPLHPSSTYRLHTIQIARFSTKKQVQRLVRHLLFIQIATSFA